MRILATAVLPVLIAPLLACAASESASSEVPTPVTTTASATTSVARAAVPGLQVTPIVTGLDHPWDVRQLPNGDLIYTQRERATLSIFDGSTSRTLDFPSSDVWVSGETGLMGLEVDPDFATNHRVYTCQGATTPTGHDVRVEIGRAHV